MIQKIIPIPINDIIADEKECSEMLNRACRRSPSWHITGGGAIGKIFWTLLEPCQNNSDGTFASYRFAKLCPCNTDEVPVASSARWCAGFTTLALFENANDVWALFACGAGGS
ncbi:MAG: hypothetical protein PHV75_08640 [Victivallaceae bacterium]|jgi:hypothetical protein|nr:hypothetical protein [Victivallaceae bacterium]MDD3703381.1 hypothetical protein [Victivallaceae bacterium]MDD4318569.1 hypothetical protein [Victivallaceae bacterium]MDD5663386.1 hypothetical protein [Victivallaceae bacterium]NLK82467.1 hypothetical protein [Lentisphaerota bacterium]